MKFFFLLSRIKLFLVLTLILFGSSPVFSQSAEIINEINEAIGNAKTGNYEQAIPILKKYAKNQGFNDLTTLEIKVYLNYCLAAEEEKVDLENLNIFIQAYLEETSISRINSLKLEKKLFTIYYAAVVNGLLENNDKMLAYLSIIRDTYENEYLNKADQLYSDVIILLTRGFYNSRDFNSVIENGKIALNLIDLSKVGENNTTISLLQMLYISYENLNQPEKALIQLNEILKIEKETLGEKNPKYLTSLDLIASSYERLGDNTKAIEIQKQVVNLRKEVLGERNLDYVSSLNKLGFLLYTLGDF